MSTLIIGSGMAGLASAVEIQMKNPDEQVMVIEQPKQVANTMIAGQRIRRRGNDRLFLKDVSDEASSVSTRFVAAAEDVLHYWERVLGSEERNEWFGPQLAGGSGVEALGRMKAEARSLGVEFTTGRVDRLIREGEVVFGVVVNRGEKSYQFSADRYVLANGGSIGALYDSTNLSNEKNGHVLAFEAGIPLVGATVNMFHPFGKCTADGASIAGCFATDDLVGVRVVTSGGREDVETMKLLDAHHAHEKFPEICARFIQHGGGKITLHFPDTHIRHAEVKLHNSLLGVETEDGVRVRGMNNLFAVGDTGSFGLTTHFNPRPAGTGQLKCLVDGLFVAEAVQADRAEKRGVKPIKYEEYADNCRQNQLPSRELKSVNTLGLLAVHFNSDSQKRYDPISSWKEQARGLADSSALGRMSLGIISAFETKSLSMLEPIRIKNERYGRMSGERL